MAAIELSSSRARSGLAGDGAVRRRHRRLRARRRQARRARPRRRARPGRRHASGAGRGFGGRGFFGSGVGAAAAYLGVPVSTLRDRARGRPDARALAVARTRRRLRGLEAAMLAAQKKARSTALVASGRLTRAQEQRLEAGLEARVKDSRRSGVRRAAEPGGPRRASPDSARSSSGSCGGLFLLLAAAGGLGDDLRRDRERDLRRRAAAEVEPCGAVDPVEVALGEALLGERGAPALLGALRADRADVAGVPLERRGDRRDVEPLLVGERDDDGALVDPVGAPRRARP